MLRQGSTARRPAIFCVPELAHGGHLRNHWWWPRKSQQEGIIKFGLKESSKRSALGHATIAHLRKNVSKER